MAERELTAPPQTPADESSRLIGGIGMLALAALMLLCGLCSAILYVIVPLTDKSATRLETSTVLGAAAGFGFFFAAILGWQGINAYRGNESSPAARFFPPVLTFALALVGAIFLGTAAFSFNSIAPYAFPPFHFLAGMLIPFIFIAYAARRLGARSELRALVASVSWGAMGATLLALIAELVTAGLLILVIAIALSSTPDGRAMLEQIRVQLQLTQRGDATRLTNQIISNSLTSTIALVYFAIIIPPIEEAVKTLSLALMNPERTRAGDAVLWGMSAGAGFAALENLFNATALLEIWAVGMILRVGATTMHVANGALMGRGWYAARVEKRWGRLGIAYAASVLFHMLWNGAVIMLSQRAAVFESDPRVAFEKLLAQGVLVLALGGVIGILSVLGVVWIVYAVQNARRNLMVS